MKALSALLLALSILIGTVSWSGADSLPGISADPPGSLLDSPRDSSRPVGIVPVATESEVPAEYRESAQLDGGGTEDRAEATFHIINGPNKSTTFEGRHYSGQILHSSYQQLPWTGVIWHHYEWGPNKSLYHK